MRKIGLISMLLVLALSLLSACASGGNAGGEQNETGENKMGTGAATDPVKLKLAIWGSEAHVEMYNGIASEYNKLNPHIQVEVMVIPWADYQQKLSIMVASKTAPDIGWVAERMIPQFMQANHIVDISDIKNDSDYDFGDFIPTTLELFENDSKLYGIPFSTPPLVTFYNKTLFEKHGLKTPMELYKEGKWNYDELAKAAKTITDPQNGVYGAQFIQASAGWADNLIQLLWAMGADVLSEDGTQFVMNSPEAAAALEYFNDLLATKAHTSLGDQLTFDTGKIGMKIENVTRTSAYGKVTDFEWDIAPLPSEGQEQSIPLGLAGYSIFEGTKHLEEAKDFLKFVTNKENAYKVAQFFVPQRKSVLYSDKYLNKTPHPSAETLKTAALDQMEKGKFRPGHPKWVNIDEQVVIHLDGFFTGRTTLEEALKRMEEQINPLLK